MTHPGFIRLFSAPLMAFLVLAIIVSAGGYLFYRIGRDKAPAAATRYWKLLTFIAEICVVVGLIGLATFAGRMKIGADHQILETRARMSQSAVAERLRLAVLGSCEPDARRPLAPYNPTVAKTELCAIARSYASVTAADADWELAEKSLRAFSTKYPGCVENVFTRHSDCSDTVDSATRIADDIALMEKDKRATRNDEAMSEVLEKPDEWEFLLLVLFIAAIGVSIKCARAAAEYFPPRQSR